MKTLLVIVTLALLQLQACVATSQRPYPNYNVTYQSFYDQLSPYGIWVNYPGYGYVWVPRLGPGFRPYATNGRWVYTLNGWTWVSNYSWGWGPFHYGRWFLDPRFGWAWIPGNQWAPAWVTWGQSGNYYGWAPIGPNMNMNVSPNMIPGNYWTFVPNQYINSPTINNYYVNNNTTVVNNVTIINNIYRGSDGRNQRDASTYFRGPQIQDVERVTRQRIRPVTIRDADRPGAANSGRDAVTIYRPAVNGNSNANTRPARIEPVDPSTPVTRPTPELPTSPVTRPNPVNPTRPTPEPEMRPRPSIDPPVTRPSVPEPTTRPTPVPGTRPTTRPAFPGSTRPSGEQSNPVNPTRPMPTTRPGQSQPTTRPGQQTRPSVGRPQPAEQQITPQTPSRRGPR
ncbi:DUF6600 domain-containing protein [Spirosoma sp. KNUC1025]|uniref:DUF6600 domain-containing protein n=1 Tax=Spirosoma sp. KNUC1025 TaxID=2894082 RepID=UPI003862F44C|nr:hypothetical protein LN737_11435 [Spirosoma sp. KNUC1025]